jgi:hypothetical protein
MAPFVVFDKRLNNARLFVAPDTTVKPAKRRSKIDDCWSPGRVEKQHLFNKRNSTLRSVTAWAA